MRAILGAIAMLFGVAVIGLVVWIGSMTLAWPRDNGQWADQNPVIAGWFAALKQPDNPALSCCGEADAYWADKVETDSDGQTVAVITDDRDDAPLNRPHVPIGTRVVVPPNKIKFDRGNPTGHIVIFLTWTHIVMCYVQNGGV